RSGNNYAYTTVKYSDAGMPLWTNRYNGPANWGDFATAMTVDGSGNVWVTGASRSSSAGSFDYATIKYSSEGVPLWINRYDAGLSSEDAAHALAVDSSGNVFVTGGSGGDYATIKYSRTGVLLWTNRYHGPNRYDFATAIAVDGNGDIVVT